MEEKELVDRKNRFKINIAYNPYENILYLKNISVEERFRDNGFAKRIIYTLWRVAKSLKVGYIIVNIISPIIEMIVKKYYIYTELDCSVGLSLKIYDIFDNDYRESILPLFLDIYYFICPK